jgi:DNA-binding MarR family transcriptional regulator
MDNRSKDPAFAPEIGFFDGILGYHLRRLSVVVMGDLTDSLAPLKLRPAGATVLIMIATNPGVTQSELGKALGILPANMAPIIAALIKRELIERKPVDGRSQALSLTAAGQSLCRKTRKAISDHDDRLFGSLTHAAKTRMLAQLRTLRSDAATLLVTQQ